jgi:transcriptional regulator with XRE-family HTH domain
MGDQLTLGEYMRRLRRAKGWQLHQLATATRMSLSHLSRIENDNAVPNAESVVKLATALDGDLERMLELANCLPREILQRLIDRAGDVSPALHRSAGIQVDPEFARALVEDIDPQLRTALTDYFDFSDENVHGLFTMLRSMARMEPAERDQMIEFLAAFLLSRAKERNP